MKENWKKTANALMVITAAIFALLLFYHFLKKVYQTSVKYHDIDSESDNDDDMKEVELSYSSYKDEDEQKLDKQIEQDTIDSCIIDVEDSSENESENESNDVSNPSNPEKNTDEHLIEIDDNQEEQSI